MPPPESAQERRERLLAAKAALVQQIHDCQDRILALKEAPKRPLLSWDSDSDTSVVITPPPALRESHNQALQHLNTRLLATQELRSIQKLDIEVEVLKHRPELPTLAAEEITTGAGVWREVAAEGRTAIVPFQMHFYVYENKKGALHYRSLTTTVVKIQHKAELQTTLSECQKPGLAIECISRYTWGYTERRNTLLELNEMFGRSLECEKLESGGFRLSCGGIVLIDWILECGVMKACRHRFRFQVADEHEIDDELYMIMKKAQQKLKEKDLSSEYRSNVLKKLIEICLGKFDLLPEVKSECDDNRIENHNNSNYVKSDTEERVEKVANVDRKELGNKNSQVPKTNTTELKDKRRAIGVDDRPVKKLKENSGKEKVRNLDVKSSAELKKERVLKQRQDGLKEKYKVQSKNDDCRQKIPVNKEQKSNKNINEQNKSNKENEIDTERTKEKSELVTKPKLKHKFKDPVEHLIPDVPQDTEQVHKIIKKQSTLKHKCVNKKETQDVEVDNERKTSSLPKVCLEREQKNKQSKETQKTTDKSKVQQKKEHRTKISTTAKHNSENKEVIYKKEKQGQPSQKSKELLQEKKKESIHSSLKTKEKELKTIEKKQKIKENNPTLINTIEHNKIQSQKSKELLQEKKKESIHRSLKTKKMEHKTIEKKQKTKENNPTLNEIEHDKIQMKEKRNVTKEGKEQFRKDKHDKPEVMENHLPQPVESKAKNIKSNIDTLSSKSQKIRDQLTLKSKENRHILAAVSGIKLKQNTSTDVQKQKTSNDVRLNMISNIKPSPVTKAKVNKTTEAKLKIPIMKSKSSIIKSKSSIVNPKSHIVKTKSFVVSPKLLEAQSKNYYIGLKKPVDRPKSLAPMDKLRSKISLGLIEKNQKTSVDARPKSISNFGNKGIQMKSFRSKIPKIRSSPRVTKSIGERKTFWTSNSKH